MTDRQADVIRQLDKYAVPGGCVIIMIGIVVTMAEKLIPGIPESLPIALILIGASISILWLVGMSLRIAGGLTRV